MDEHVREMKDDKNIYEEWAVRSAEFWKERCRVALGEEYENLLRVARAAKKLKDEYDPYETMSVLGGINALFEALKELPDGLLEEE